MNHSILFRSFLFLALFVGIHGASVSFSWGQSASPPKFHQEDKFRQLEEILPTPNQTRAASGAPGAGYWQQQVDYTIAVRIDDQHHLFGSESIHYHNNSPDTLRYLWLQLDANLLRPDAQGRLAKTAEDMDTLSFRQLNGILERETFDGGVTITKCIDAKRNQPLKYTIVKTMMRIELPQPLAHGESFTFQIDWDYTINNARVVRARTGYELFEDKGGLFGKTIRKNVLYEIAQWFPRLCAYTDVHGWQHKQYLGTGEFTLEFGNYLVQITMPQDHVVAATGVLLNADQVLTPTQRKRLVEAKTAKQPVFIVTPSEAKKNESRRPSSKTKTWIFSAEHVRDFAFASSRKFIWDAWGCHAGDSPVMAMSFYPKEGEPLWSHYSTHAIVHTLEVYSRYTFDYPYPVANSINGPVGGMEYPMICFNGPRPNSDGEYSAATKYALISVVIHEVGHNFFPMIVNSDERQWTWMDEGINSFLQYLAEQEWEENYPSRCGEPRDIVGYMQNPDQVPIMTNAESLHHRGANAYFKPATALNILRETILGRELFDYAFKEYARRWKFKRPMPADFFRTMEDASGVDLDWFWRGWFYSTDHVDIALVQVEKFNVDTLDPDHENAILREQRDKVPPTRSEERNAAIEKRTDRYPELLDSHNEAPDPLDVSDDDRGFYRYLRKHLSPKERKLLEEKRNFYILKFQNVGGLVMPILLELEFEDGSKQEIRLPAEIWMKNNEEVRKLIITEKTIKSIVVDPRQETADVDRENNYYPRQVLKSRFQLYRNQR